MGGDCCGLLTLLLEHRQLDPECRHENPVSIFEILNEIQTIFPQDNRLDPCCYIPLINTCLYSTVIYVV
jgi:hypothetical protein